MSRTPPRPCEHVWEERPVWGEVAGRARIVRRCLRCGRTRPLEEVADGR